MISIIIPSYNRAEFLKEAIQSVLDQDYLKSDSDSRRFELLVIDDGSTDQTKAAVESFSSPLLYRYQDHKGVSAARNLGIKLSKGDYVAFLDSDDLWKTDKITIQMSLMKSLPQTKICYTEETWIRNSVFVNPRKKHQKYSGWIFEKVLPLCLLSLSSALFHRSIFEKIGIFDEDFPACEDYDFGLRVALRYPIHLITKPLIVKRGGHSDQLSHQFWGMDQFRVRALEKVFQMDLSPQQKGQVRRELIKKCKILAVGFEKRNKMSEAEYYSDLIEKYQKKQEEK
ncbi:MAG: glycosyltransferase family 2 protein [Candidatus Aminicenantes bacterium]|nr:glycosyltransferase family 2 protein [Candidatus Aminicenantes bacterium]